jgi:NADPH:quinone reductase-like Zn-dependent oxidoreductase
MKAILLNEAGGVENLVYRDIDKPTLKKGEVLVKVKAIGINPADAKVRSSAEMITRFLGDTRPAILGWDVSGEIVEKAEKTDEFEIGDSIFGLLSGRGYAEYVAVPANILAHKPVNISYEEAAVIPMAALTAWGPLVHVGKIKKGDKVLIHAGAGGVGHFAIQIAKYFGATVIATSSAKNRDFILSLGADQHIDYTTQKFYELVSDLDFVLDTIGGDTLSHSIDVVKGNGIIVSVIPGFSDEIKEKACKKNVHLLSGGIDLEHLGEDIKLLADLFSNSLLKPHISAVYSFAEMAKAHIQVESGRTIGKIVVTL